MVMVLSGLSAAILDERAAELALHYDHFLSVYDGDFLIDAYVGFTRMMHSWPSRWPTQHGSALNGLSFEDFYLA